MLNENANCYNIEKKFQIQSPISEHFQLIFDKSNVNNERQIKQKMANFFLQTFQNYQIFLPYPSEESHFGIKNCNSSAFLLHTSNTFCTVELFFIFFTNFYGTNFRHQNKNNVVETTSCFVDQLSKKYCLY